MTDRPWHAARAASRRPLPKPRKMHGPVGPSVEQAPHSPGVRVNGVGVLLSVDEAFSLGVDIPALGISAYGPHGKRGDGRPTCEGCGYHICSCPPRCVGCHQAADMPHIDGCIHGTWDAVWKNKAYNLRESAKLYGIDLAGAVQADQPAYCADGRPNYMTPTGGPCCENWRGDRNHAPDCPKIHSEHALVVSKVDHETKTITFETAPIVQGAHGLHTWNGMTATQLEMEARRVEQDERQKVLDKVRAEIDKVLKQQREAIARDETDRKAAFDTTSIMELMKQQDEARERALICTHWAGLTPDVTPTHRMCHPFVKRGASTRAVVKLHDMLVELVSAVDYPELYGKTEPTLIPPSPAQAVLR